MRISSLLPSLLILPLGMFGCSQPWGVRTNSADGVRTVASVGDKPLPIRSGTPDSSVRAGDPEPLLAPSSRGRISGRVYDDRGKPVPGAKVRLAVGSEPGGKALVATTDSSGAFTLRGLRPGSSYTLIAEYQKQGGSLWTGRVDTEAPDTDVRIGLERKAARTDDARGTIRPARPGVAPISNVEEVEESDDLEKSSPRVNREDLEPPAPEAEEAMTGLGTNGSRRFSTAGDTGARSAGWSHRRPAEHADSGQGGSTHPRSEGDPTKGGGAATGASGDDDEENPLPPALEPEHLGSAPDRDDAPRGGRSVGLARGRAEETASRDNSAPGPLPRPVVSQARINNPEAYAPISLGDSDDQEAGTVQTQGPRSRQVSGRSASASARTLLQPAEPQSRPTWGELVFQMQPIPLDESIHKASLEQMLSAQQTVPASTANRVELPATIDPARPARAAAGGEVSCQFDPTERRLLDFQFPDVRGKMVSFHDFDADLILLDFWGTWCSPCRKSIPHLNEIQAALGGKKMQVIGIACERTKAKDRAAKVAQTIQQLKINYPVLITGMDGTCPLQSALQIQFYPTMVLLDGKGRILWREQGATDVTLARMDRFILKNLHRSGAGQPLQSRVAEAKAELPRR
jgi:thiol-disulfide isomerase/thioredoxin